MLHWVNQIEAAAMDALDQAEDDADMWSEIDFAGVITKLLLTQDAHGEQSGQIICEVLSKVIDGVQVYQKAKARHWADLIAGVRVPVDTFKLFAELPPQGVLPETAPSLSFACMKEKVQLYCTEDDTGLVAFKGDIAKVLATVRSLPDETPPEKVCTDALGS